MRGGNKKHTCAWDNCDHEGQQLHPKEEKKIHNFKDDTQRSIEDAISGKDMKVIENNEKTRLKEKPTRRTSRLSSLLSISLSEEQEKVKCLAHRLMRRFNSMETSNLKR